VSRPYDTAEVIAVCREAADAGERQIPALMEHFDVDAQRASNMLHWAKRCHPDHNLPRNRKGPAVGTTGKHDYALVSRVAIDAFNRQQRLASVVAERFGISDRNASQLLTRLRKRGWPIPYCPTAPHGPHLRALGCCCEECRADTEEMDTAEAETVEPDEPTPLKVTVVGTIQLPEAALPMGPWVKHAACKGVDTNLFYPERGEPTRHALEVCKPCTVKAECLQYAIDNSERWGVWGGMTERQRRRIRSDRYQARRNAQ